MEYRALEVIKCYHDNHRNSSPQNLSRCLNHSLGNEELLIRYESPPC